MFGSKQRQINELQDNLVALWEAFAQQAKTLAVLSDLMKKIATASLEQREMYDDLAKQTLRIAETQNKIVSHLTGKKLEDYITRDFTGSIH